MKDPAISIILPTRGERPSLAVALRSALGQTAEDYEIIVVDDAKPESKWTEERPCCDLLRDPRIKIVRCRQGRGCAAAKNAGLDAARGKWICYLDDDNAYKPSKVFEQHRLAEAEGSLVVLCGLEIRAGARRCKRQTTVNAFSGDALLLEAWADTNVLFHRRDLGLRWDEEIGTADDACFFQSILSLHHLTKVSNVPEPLVIYCAHSGERANTDYKRLYCGIRRLLIRHTRDYPREVRRLWLRRHLVSLCKYRRHSWVRLFGCAFTLLRAGGWCELRLVANAIAVKTPLVRRWMIR